MTAPTKYWTCSMCGSVWPANAILEAFLKHMKANEVHPGTQCEKEKEKDNVR